MNPSKNDIRYIKTDRSIQDSFWTLMSKKGFSHMSVQDIIKESMINRSTFYDHYKDKYDLLDQLENTMIDEMHCIMLNNIEAIRLTHTVSDDNLHIYLKQILQYFYENAAHFSLLMIENGNTTFQTKLQQSAQQIWKEADILKELIIPPKYAAVVVSSVISTMIIEWIKSGFEENIDEFTTIMYSVCQRRLRFDPNRRRKMTYLRRLPDAGSISPTRSLSFNLYVFPLILTTNE